MATIQGVIFDVDGTLVDSNDVHARAWADAFTEQGYDVSFEQVRGLIGMGGDNLLPEVIGKEKDSPEGHQLSERRSAIFKERYLPTIKPFPQVDALLARMRDSGVKLVIASSAQDDELTALLEIAKATSFFMATTSADDAKNSKPDPDIVQAALQRIQFKPEQVVMIGDTPYDIESANKAGVAVIALRCGGWNDDELQGAIAIYDDPADLLAHYDESPFGSRAQSQARGV